MWTLFSVFTYMKLLLLMKVNHTETVAEHSLPISVVQFLL